MTSTDVFARLAGQPRSEKLIRNRLIQEGHGYREATRLAAGITGRGTAAPAGPRDSTGKAARKEAREAARRAVIVRQVTEALTAAQAPQPPPGTGQAPGPQSTSRAAVPAKPLQELSANELTDALVATQRGSGRKSPFWTQAARETAPAGSVREALQPGNQPHAAHPLLGRPLHTLTNEEFNAVAGATMDVYSEAQGMSSPLWRGATGA